MLLSEERRIGINLELGLERVGVENKIVILSE